MEAHMPVITGQRSHKTDTVDRADANQAGATFGNVGDGLVRDEPARVDVVA